MPRQQLSPPLPLPAPGSAPAAACHPTQASFWAVGSSGAQCVGIETIWDLDPHPHHSYLAEPCLPVQCHTLRDKSQVREAALNSVPTTTPPRSNVSTWPHAFVQHLGGSGKSLTPQNRANLCRAWASFLLPAPRPAALSAPPASPPLILKPETLCHPCVLPHLAQTVSKCVLLVHQRGVGSQSASWGPRTTTAL